jgi:hypothetical protein
VCQVGLARRTDTLVRLMPRALVLQLDTWITMHEDLRNSPRCRATFDALAEGLQQYVDGQKDAGARGKMARASTQASE